MPIFYENTSVDIDIDVDDFLEECDHHEIKEIITWLSLNNNCEYDSTLAITDNPHNEHLHKEIIKLLSNIRLLTQSEEDIITNIAKRF